MISALRPSPRRAHPSRRGSEDGSLILVVLLAIVVGGIMVVAMNYALGARRQTRIDRDYTDALHVAETGVERALVRLRQGDGASAPNGGTIQDTDGDPSWETERVGDELVRYQATRNNPTTWQVRSESCVTGPRPADWAECRTLGGRVRTLEAEVRRDALFWLAAFGTSGMELPGNNRVTTIPGTGSELGYVGSNERIVFRGNSTAEGAFLYGSQAVCVHRGNDGSIDDCPIDVDGDGTLDGLANVEYTSDPVQLQDAFIEERCVGRTREAFLASDFGGVVPPHPSGYYCATDVWFDVPTTITGTADDPVVIYATGDVVTELLPGTGVNCLPTVCTLTGYDDTLGTPPDTAALQIYTTGSNVEFTANTYFAGGIYAPHATCDGRTSNAGVDFYGSLICNKVENVGGWTFYYDPALLEVGSDEFAVVTWREEVGGSTSFTN